MEKSNLKKFINDDLSEALQSHVTYDEIVDVAKETGVSPSTLLSVRKQKVIVTDRSKKAVNKLAEIAFKNASNAELDARKCKKCLKEFLDCI